MDIIVIFEILDVVLVVGDVKNIVKEILLDVVVNILQIKVKSFQFVIVFDKKVFLNVSILFFFLNFFNCV